MLGAALALTTASCVADTDEGTSVALRLRGGAELVLRPGTTFDRDELVSREHYGATLTDELELPWFVRVETIDGASLDGLDPLIVDGAAIRLGILDLEDGAQCVVVVPFSEGAAVALSRLVGASPCPERAEELEWLPEVRASDDDAPTSFRVAYGSVVGGFNGITAYSNGSNDHVSGSYSTCGLKWQCVEYVNRYVYQRLGHTNLKGTGNARDYFGTAASKGLTAYSNGGSVAPKVGDMLTSAGPNGSVGHIAVVREVGADYVKVIHQNWSNSSSDNSKTLSMSVASGKYTVVGFSANYPVQGWLRKTSCSPSVSSVSPTSAKLNTTTNFTVSGSCLPSTTVAWVANCENMKVTGATTTQMTFSCRPSHATGAQSGVIKHATDGMQLRNFTLSVY